MCEPLCAGHRAGRRGRRRRVSSGRGRGLASVGGRRHRAARAAKTRVVGQRMPTLSAAARVHRLINEPSECRERWRAASCLHRSPSRAVNRSPRTLSKDAFLVTRKRADRCTPSFASDAEDDTTGKRSVRFGAATTGGRCVTKSEPVRESFLSSDER
jgi:hypothetical protein